jgi:hypothetical protein
MGGESDYFEFWPMYREVNSTADFPISRMLEGTSKEIIDNSNELTSLPGHFWSTIKNKRAPVHHSV